MNTKLKARFKARKTTAPVVTTTTKVSVFTSQVPIIPAGPDGGGVPNLSMVFKSTTAGNITKAGFYRQAAIMGIGHIARIYNLAGTLLGEVVFTSEDPSFSGWDFRAFAKKIPIAANTPYMVAVTFLNSIYAAANTSNGDTVNFSGPITNGVLTAYQDGGDGSTYTGANGRFDYSPTPIFPASTFHSANYWVDIVLEY